MIDQMVAANSRSSDTIKMIPVVVHVLHDGSSENISDTQVQSQIDVLNEDFGKLSGSNGDGNGVDTKIRFCLARISPNGDCTNGIVRIKTPYTNHQTWQRDIPPMLSHWPGDRYMNLYVVRGINNGGIAGYASYPGWPADQDAVFVDADMFGDTGTVSAPNHLGRTGTHELGHWLNLFHTFSGGCGLDTCLDGDKVCDTPPVATANFGCPSVNSCSNDSSGTPDQVENYMDYTSDACKNMFTAGQRDRMHAALTVARPIMFSDSNLIATGCDSNYIAPGSCSVVADFVTFSTQVCAGNDITLYSRSLNNPTSWQWSFPGGSPSSSSVETPKVNYSTVGNYDVTLIVGNGSSFDTLTEIGYVQVISSPVAQAPPFYEDFESQSFPANGISIYNPEQDLTWERDTSAAFDGAASARIDNLINIKYGAVDALTLPALDFSSAASTSTIELNYKWAYAPSSSTSSDILLVQISEDCGYSYKNLLYRTGNFLATAALTTDPFVPDSAEWDSQSVTLNDYIGMDHVIIRFHNTTDGGNALYLDDVSVVEKLSIGLEQERESSFVVFPNPATDLLKIRLHGGNMQSAEVEISDLSGKIVHNIQGPSEPSEEIEISIAELKPGFYLLSLFVENQRLYRKIYIRP